VLAKGYSSRRAAALARSIKLNRRWIKVSSDQYVLRVKQIKTIGVSKIWAMLLFELAAKIPLAK